MINILRDNHLLLLFLVAGTGYLVGRIRVAGNSLGVAAVLFAGLAFGALDPGLKLPEIVYQLGLALFVYTVGLSSGPGFFASFRGKGLRDNLFVVSLILLGAVMSVAIHIVLDLRPAQTVGMFTGSLTNTPALAAAVEYLKQYGGPNVNLSDPIVGYSLAYPISVLGILLAITVAQKVWRIDYAQEAKDTPGTVPEKLINVTVRVLRPEVVGEPVASLQTQHRWKLVFGRRIRNGEVEIVAPDTTLKIGDLVTAVGTPAELDDMVDALGELSHEEADLDRRVVDLRRAFVSNPKVAGRRIRDLGIHQRFGAVVTRVRRGDVDLLAHDDLVLELGDKVRMLAPRSVLKDVTAFFGDSVKELSEINMSSFAFGLTLGICVGLIPIPLPGGIVLKLGLAGGPLLVAILLGRLVRTGPIIWSLPFSANLILRQLGLILFLAGVGTRAGYEFYRTVAEGSGYGILAGSALIVAVVGFLVLWIGYKLLKIPMGILTGMVAALQTQPATLGFALEQSRNELPNVGYATCYPAAMVTKIVLAQVMLSFLR